MKYLISIILVMSLLFGGAIYASDISDADFYGVITTTNNSTASASDVSSNISNSTNLTANLISGGFLNSSANNCALQNSSGTDIAFMPGYLTNPWIIWAGNMAGNAVSNSILYAKNVTGGKLRYFPGATGMTTTDDDAALETGDNFTLEYSGYIDTSAGASKYIFNHYDASNGGIRCFVSSTVTGNITSTIYGATTSPYSSTSDANIYASDHTYATAQAAASGTVNSGATTMDIGQRPAGDTSTVTQSARDGGWALNGADRRAGERANSFSGIITSVSFTLIPENSPTGTAYARVRKVSDDSILGTIGSINVATLPPGWASYTFNSAPVYIPVSTDIRIMIEHSGDAVNYITLGQKNTDVEAFGIHTTYNAGYSDSGTVDATFQVIYDKYRVDKAFVYFPTQTIPDTATITEATLKAYGQTDGSTTDFDITIQSGMPTFPSDPLLATDYDKTNYSGDGGSVSTSGFTTSGYNTITLNATGLGWINKTGTTKFCLRSSRDISATAPTGNEYVTVYASEQGGTDKDPQLTVTYYIENSIAGISSGEHTLTLKADGTNFWMTVDGSPSSNMSMASPGNSTANWLDCYAAATPYVEYVKKYIGGNLQQYIYWENATPFTDHSPGGAHPATPTFRSSSSDADVSSVLSSFLPTSQPKAPAFALGSGPAFISSNITQSGNFTTGNETLDYPLKELIDSVSDASGTPRQLPSTIIATFLILIASMLTGYFLKTQGASSFFVKSIVNTIGYGIAVGLKIYDWWMILFFFIFEIAFWFAAKERRQ